MAKNLNHDFFDIYSNKQKHNFFVFIFFLTSGSVLAIKSGKICKMKFPIINIILK
jgi:hypothetical protein